MKRRSIVLLTVVMVLMSLLAMASVSESSAAQDSVDPLAKNCFGQINAYDASRNGSTPHDAVIDLGDFGYETAGDIQEATQNGTLGVCYESIGLVVRCG
jgi:hypothetical protein